MPSHDGDVNGKSAQNTAPSWTSSDYPYPTDYNDHFETPLIAYQDVQPIIDAYFASLSRSDDDDEDSQRILYDPYYCNGRTKTLLHQLGYTHVLHERRDFYTEPATDYTILITNPPFSENHKQRCLEFCTQSGKPWLVLLPAYCITKQYVMKITATTATSTQQNSPLRFCIPSTRYHYAHPASTGHAECPFRDSVWLCGGFPLSVVEAYTTASVEVVAKRLGVRLDNRPNPRQRRRKQLHSNEKKGYSGSDSATSDMQGGGDERIGHEIVGKGEDKVRNDAGRSIGVQPPRKKRSKYRDANGKRTKSRF